MRRVTNTNLLFWVTLPKALTEHFLHANVPLRHLLNAKSLFIPWRRSAYNEVNDWDRSVLLQKIGLAFWCFYTYIKKLLELHENMCLIFFNLKLGTMYRYVGLDFLFYFTKRLKSAMHEAWFGKILDDIVTKFENFWPKISS